MTWSFKISDAPRDRQVLMATNNGKLYLTRWLIPTKFTPDGRWDGFSENAKTLFAWCAVPAHPHHQSDVDAVAEVNGKDRLANADRVELSTSYIIPELHVFLDDCGGGA